MISFHSAGDFYKINYATWLIHLIFFFFFFLLTEIAHGTTDPKHGYDCVRDFVQQHPYSSAAWNCYYKVASRYSFW